MEPLPCGGLVALILQWLATLRVVISAVTSFLKTKSGRRFADFPQTQSVVVRRPNVFGMLPEDVLETLVPYLIAARWEAFALRDVALISKSLRNMVALHKADLLHRPGAERAALTIQKSKLLKEFLYRRDDLRDEYERAWRAPKYAGFFEPGNTLTLDQLEAVNRPQRPKWM